MDYNFDEIIPRRNTHSIKWDADGDDNLLPMWVADMDFKTAPEIIEALHQRVDHGIFGYSLTPPEFYAAIGSWWKKRHGITVKANSIIPTTGIIPALIGIVHTYCQTGDKVLVLIPVYDHFFSCIRNADCEPLESNLIYQNGNYSIDFEDLERKASDPKTKLIMLSNPHNPAGRVWTEDELKQIGDVCIKHDVKIISDEIHSDLIHPGFKHVPFTSLGEKYSQNSITCCSPSKTFNLAGLQVGYVFSANPDIKDKVEKAFHKQEMFLVSPFASTALIAAYTHGEEWLEALQNYLHENFRFLSNFISKELPKVHVTPLQGTYLVWLDLSAYSIESASFCKKLLEEQQLWLNSGYLYGKAGNGFVRMNIACPRALLKEGVERLRVQLISQ